MVIIHEPKYSLPRLILAPKTMSFGHVQVAINCEIDGKNYYELTGATGDNQNLHMKMFQQGYGLKPLLTQFDDLTIEDQSMAEKSITRSIEKGDEITGYMFEAKNCEDILLRIRKMRSHQHQYKFSIQDKENSLSCVKFGSFLIRDIISTEDIMSTTYFDSRWIGSSEGDVSISDFVFYHGDDAEFRYYDIEKLENHLNNSMRLLRSYQIN